MAKYVIAGKANDPAFAAVEMLGYNLAMNCPDFRVTIVPIAPNEWSGYVKKQFENHKWDIRAARDRTLKVPESLSQLVYLPSGELVGFLCLKVGDASDFQTLIWESYRQDYPLEDYLLIDIAKENMAKFLGVDVSPVSTGTGFKGLF